MTFWVNLGKLPVQVSLHCDPRAASSCCSKLQRLEEWIAETPHETSSTRLPKIPELNGGFFMGTSTRVYSGYCIFAAGYICLVHYILYCIFCQTACGCESSLRQVLHDLNSSWARSPGKICADCMSHFCTDHASAAFKKRRRQTIQVHQMIHWWEV